MDLTTQIVLLFMTIVLGSTLVIVGIMLIFVLKDLRGSISRANSILDDVEELTSKTANGSQVIEEVISNIQEMVQDFKDKAASPVGSIIGLISKFKKKHRKGGEEHG